MKSRFGIGGSFKCGMCTRQTRDVGDNGACGLCPECYEISGFENSLSDNGPNWEHATSTLKEIERLKDECRKKGGKI